LEAYRARVSPQDLSPGTIASDLPGRVADKADIDLKNLVEALIMELPEAVRKRIYGNKYESSHIPANDDDPSARIADDATTGAQQALARQEAEEARKRMGKQG
jgi:hypothetical protein